MNCPSCGKKSVGTSIEDGEVLYFCDNCGWQKIEHEPFYVEAWSVTIRQALAPIDILHSLLTDNNIVTFLRPKLKGISHLGLPNDPFIDDGYIRGEVQSAYEAYLNQMEVLAATYIELITNDFLRCWSNAEAQRVSALSKEDRKPSKLLAKLVTDCGMTLNLPLSDDIKALIERRNHIVHEGRVHSISLDQILNSYGQVMYYLYILGEAALKFEIPVVDEFGFINDFKKKLRGNEE